MGRWKGTLSHELWSYLVEMGFRGKTVWIPQFPGRWPVDIWKRFEDTGMVGKTIYVPKTFLMGDLRFKAKQLKEMREKGNSLRTIAKLLSIEEGRPISFMTVKRLLESE